MCGLKSLTLFWKVDSRFTFSTTRWKRHFCRPTVAREKPKDLFFYGTWTLTISAVWAKSAGLGKRIICFRAMLHWKKRLLKWARDQGKALTEPDHCVSSQIHSLGSTMNWGMTAIPTYCVDPPPSPPTIRRWKLIGSHVTTEVSIFVFLIFDLVFLYASNEISFTRNGFLWKMYEKWVKWICLLSCTSFAIRHVCHPCVRISDSWKGSIRSVVGG